MKCGQVCQSSSLVLLFQIQKHRRSWTKSAKKIENDGREARKEAEVEKDHVAERETDEGKRTHFDNSSRIIFYWRMFCRTVLNYKVWTVKHSRSRDRKKSSRRSRSGSRSKKSKRSKRSRSRNRSRSKDKREKSKSKEKEKSPEKEPEENGSNGMQTEAADAEPKPEPMAEWELCDFYEFLNRFQLYDWRNWRRKSIASAMSF